MENKMGKIAFCTMIMALCGLSACRNSPNNAVQQSQMADTNMPATVIMEEEIISVEVDSIPVDSTNIPKSKPMNGKK